MAHVLAHMTMSLDGRIADEDDQVGALFDWYDAGPVAVTTATPRVEFHLDEAGAEMLRPLLSGVGAVVCGRRLFDLTDGWDDRHPLGAPVIVVTHAPPDASRWPRTRFVPDVATAIELATEVAANRIVAIASADVAGQALDLGLVDEVAVSLVPLIMGRGKPFFASVRRGPILLDDPTVIPGTRATHLRYRVQRRVDDSAV